MEAQRRTITQNWFATLALLAWPIVALWLYRTRPVNQATLWTILGALTAASRGRQHQACRRYPAAGQDFDTVPCCSCGMFLHCRRRLRFWNGFGLAEVLLLMLLIGPFVSSELNADPVVSGSLFLPSLGAYDGLSAIVAQLLFLLPFFLGRQLLRNSADIEEILRTLIIAGLLYSLPMLFEIRMSPQLHYWFYGYRPFGFDTQMRYGGFRPTVFMETGWSLHSLQ